MPVWDIRSPLILGGGTRPLRGAVDELVIAAFSGASFWQSGKVLINDVCRTYGILREETGTGQFISFPVSSL